MMLDMQPEKKKPGLWQKGGPSPNPKGRGLKADLLRTIIDTVAAKLGDGEGAAREVEIIMQCARGVMVDPHNPGAFKHVDAKTQAAAAQWVAESFHGKPTQALAIDHSGSIETPQVVDLTLFEAIELATLERLLEKGQPALTDLQEAELVPALSPGDVVEAVSSASPEDKGDRNE